MTNFVNEVDHNRLTASGLPCAYVRLDADQYNSARAIFGTESEEDDKRLYRALQAYEHEKNNRIKADSDIDIDDGA